jgi:hypothetical protein
VVGTIVGIFWIVCVLDFSMCDVNAKFGSSNLQVLMSLCYLCNLFVSLDNVNVSLVYIIVISTI